MFDGFLLHIVIFVIPLTLANLSHMICVKLDLFSGLAVPISKRLFGDAKTYRGFVLLAFFTAFYCPMSVYVFSSYFDPFTILIGAVLGITYALGELPNSLIKRRLSIESGQQGERKFVQLVFDKMDSLLFLIPVYYIVSDISIVQSFFLFLLSLVIHLFLSFVIWKLGLKKSW